jgi:hypothetical protein
MTGNGQHHRANGHTAARLDPVRLARARVLHTRPAPADLVRQTAARRLERRLGAGVVAFADLREEQDHLEWLAGSIACERPLAPERFAAVARLARETAPPPLASSLAELRRLRDAPDPAIPGRERRQRRRLRPVLRRSEVRRTP